VFKWQFGQFLILMGLIGLIVFIMTDQVRAPNYLFFCSGVLVILMGVYMMWLGRNPPQPSERFRLLRKRTEKRAEKEKK